MKVYAYITPVAADIIPEGDVGYWFPRRGYDARTDEYRVQLPDGGIRVYVGMDLNDIANRTLAMNAALDTEPPATTS